MMIARRIKADGLQQLSPLTDTQLVTEEAVLRIGSFGLEMGFMPLPRPEWRSFLPADYADPAYLVTDEASAVYGVFDAEKHIGIAAVTTTPSGWADVIDLRVDAAFRRQGAGRMLLDKCDSFARKRELHGVRVACTDDNPVMCRFLLHEGFTLCGYDAMVLTRSPQQRLKPKSKRVSLLFFYRLTQKG